MAASSGMTMSGDFVVISPATQGLTDAAKTALVAQISAQITASFEAFLGSTGQEPPNTLPKIVEQVGLLKTEVGTITDQLNASMPGIGDAQAKFDESQKSLVQRDKEVSDKVKASLADIEKRLTEFSFKTNAIDSMQSSVHEAVGRQQTDRASADIDIERVVNKVLSDIEALSQARQQQLLGGTCGSAFT